MGEGISYIGRLLKLGCIALLHSLSLSTEPSQQTLTRDRMVVPTGNHLPDSNVCRPGGKP